MRNASSCCCSSRVGHLQQAFGSQAPPHGFYDGNQLTSPPRVEMEEQVTRMPLLHALASLNLLLLLAYLLLFLLVKLFARLHLRATSTNGTRGDCDHVAGINAEREDDVAVAADIAGGQQQADMLFWFDEAVFEDSTLLGDEGKDRLYTAAAHCLQVESTFPTEESTRISLSPREDQYNDATATGQEEAKDIAVCVADAPTVPDQQSIPVVASPQNVSVQEKESSRGEDARRDDDHRGHREEEEEEKGFSEDHVKLFVNNRALADTKKLLLEGVVGGQAGGHEEEKDKDSRFGASTLTSESTSKSSVEWRSSTVTKDSETEYPFSSSSRRSSSRWESYTLFRKYDEDMVYFHRVGAQKLTETESFRSIKYQPRSMSERIVQKLTPKPSAPIGLRDPYPDLERVYVAQICLTWEALNWNYTSFRRHNGDGSMIEARCCPARVAQEFQQFQVLLHRFIENEPYEYGRRPEVYARMKNSSPKLLLVPEFREEDDEKDDLISAVQFLYILEESIRTFMTFLRGDKRSHYQMFKEMVKRRSSAADQTLVITLKKANKKKSRLKDLTRPRRCLKRTKLREDEEMPILLGLIDLKVVARVLRMPEITDQQLHWCEEKMNKVRVDLDGKMQRDPSPLFFPAH